MALYKNQIANNAILNRILRNGSSYHWLVSFAEQNAVNIKCLIEADTFGDYSTYDNDPSFLEKLNVLKTFIENPTSRDIQDKIEVLKGFCQRIDIKIKNLEAAKSKEPLYHKLPPNHTLAIHLNALNEVQILDWMVNLLRESSELILTQSSAEDKAQVAAIQIWIAKKYGNLTNIAAKKACLAFFTTLSCATALDIKFAPNKTERELANPPPTQRPPRRVNWAPQVRDYDFSESSMRRQSVNLSFAAHPERALNNNENSPVYNADAIRQPQNNTQSRLAEFVRKLFQLQIKTLKSIPQQIYKRIWEIAQFNASLFSVLTDGLVILFKLSCIPILTCMMIPLATIKVGLFLLEAMEKLSPRSRLLSFMLGIACLALCLSTLVGLQLAGEYLVYLLFHTNSVQFLKTLIAFTPMVSLGFSAAEFIAGISLGIGHQLYRLGLFLKNAFTASPPRPNNIAPPQPPVFHQPPRNYPRQNPVRHYPSARNEFYDYFYPLPHRINDSRNLFFRSPFPNPDNSLRSRYNPDPIIEEILRQELGFRL